MNLDHFVFKRNYRQLFLSHFTCRNLPGADIAEYPGAQPERIYCFIKPGTTGILGSGDPPMMPPVMLYIEMHVQGGHQGELCQQSLILFMPVPKFMTDIDSKRATD